uniref:Glutaredoxin domain-containing protein n=1 Tax=Hemiselmis tepida TaxID=464990 RepID=A0A7S0W4X3_9CRYP|mmetsp:Transcript_5277/g.13481  ORF Transcript_5277/g.13481 Transcript_5277/m.13481 type:complete len:135 (+) Transcript_5277:28-432(+)
MGWSTSTAASAVLGLSIALAITGVVHGQSGEDYMREAIAKNKVQIFSKSYCPYCKSTKSLFDSIGVPYSVDELDQRDDGASIQESLAKLTGQRTVPNVFIGGQHVGGNSECQAAKSNGKLKELLSKAKVSYKEL